MTRNDTESFFHYSRLLKEVNHLVAELASQGNNNPSYKHIWKVYQKAIDFEAREREVNSTIFDALPQLPSDLKEELTGAGRSQNIANDRDAMLLLQKAGNANQSVMDKVKLMREICVRGATSTIGTEQRLMLQEQLESLRNEIERIAQSTRYNGEQITIGGDSSVSIIHNIQVGTQSESVDSLYVTTMSLMPNDILLPVINNGTDMTAGSMADYLQSIDDSLTTITNFIVKNGSDINKLRSAMAKAKDDIFTMSKNLEMSLRGVAGYLRQMAEFYYSISAKKDIPSILQ